MDDQLKQFLNFGYDIVIVNFEQLLRDYIKDIVIIKNQRTEWKKFIPAKVIELFEQGSKQSIEEIEDVEEFLSKTYLSHSINILLDKQNFLHIKELAGDISRSKFSRLMKFIIRSRNKIAHRNNFSQIEFGKTIEACKEICKGEYAQKFIEYLKEEKYLNAKDIPAGFFEIYECQQNLPPEDYELEGGFVGREKEIENMIELIKAGEDRIFTITGVGGAGKTAIALKVAYTFLEDDEQIFEAIIWFSAKVNKLSAEGIVQIEPQISNAEKLIKDFMKLIDPKQYDIFLSAEVPIENWKIHLYNLFRDQKSLIVIDNLETIYTDQNIIKFITEIPRPSCVLITSRKGLGMLDHPIPIGSLSIDEAVELFKLVVKVKNIENLINLEDNKIEELVKKVKCYPLLIKWAIGQYHLGKPIDQSFNSYIAGDSEIAKFAFNDVFLLLSDKAKKILYSFIIFGEEGITQHLIQYLTLLSEEDFDDGIQELKISSLAFPKEKQIENKIEVYYNILPITRGFIETKLNEDLQTKLFLLNRYNDQIKQLEKSIAVYQQTVFSIGIKTVEQKIAFNFVKSAKTNIESDNEQEAEKCFNEAVKVAPKLDYVWTEYSKFEFLRKNYSKALEYANKAVSLGQENFHTWWNYGNLLRRNGDYQESIDVLKQAKKINPDFLPIYSELGLVYSILGLYEKAEEEFNLALKEEKQPNFKQKMYTLTYQANNYLKLAQAYNSRRDFSGEIDKLKKAEKSISEALSINPTNGSILKTFREINLALGIAFGYKKDPIFLDYLNKAKDDIPLNLSINKANQSFKSEVESKIEFFKQRIKNNNQINSEKEIEESKTLENEQNLIEFKEAINFLVEALEKTTRFLAIDKLMRDGSHNRYRGSRSVINPETGEPFKSFSRFIEYVEKQGIIKVEIIEGFKEVLLLDSEIDTDSLTENNNENLDNLFINQKISKDHWILIMNKIIEAFSFKKPGHYMFGQFMILLKYIRVLKLQKLIPYSNLRLRGAISDLVKVGFLIKQVDGSYRLVLDYSNNFDKYVDSLIKNQENY